MKQLSRFALFCFILLCVMLALHLFLNYGLRKSKLSNWGVWNEVISGKVNADIIFAGSSRAFHHFDPLIIGKITDRLSYNIGSDGSFFELQYPRLSAYYANNVSPKILVQGVDIESLETRKYVWKGEQYIPYLGIRDVYDSVLEVDRNFWRQKYIPLYSYGYYGYMPLLASINGYFPFVKENHIVRGYYAVNKKWTNDFDKFKTSYPNGYEYPIEVSAINKLKRIIETAEANGTEVILVYTPEYFENFNYSKNRAKIINIYKRIAFEYKIQFWDYSSSPICKSKDNFYNSQHLNKVGAERFSAQFANDLKIYLSRDKK